MPIVQPYGILKKMKKNKKRKKIKVNWQPIYINSKGKKRIKNLKYKMKVKPNKNQISEELFLNLQKPLAPRFISKSDYHFLLDLKGEAREYFKAINEIVKEAEEVTGEDKLRKKRESDWIFDVICNNGNLKKALKELNIRVRKD
jgi:hypothetical protein